MSSPRPTRNTPRYQSPFPPLNNDRSEPARLAAGVPPRKRTLIEDWLEPSLAPAKPSFAEAGIERHGVVANMAPLGTLPSAKVMKAAVRPEIQELGARGGVVKRSGASSLSATSSEPMHTPEPTRQSSAPAAAAGSDEAVEKAAEKPVPATPVAPAVLSRPNTTPKATTQPLITQAPAPVTPRSDSQGVTPYESSIFARDGPPPSSDKPHKVPQPVAPPPMNTNGEITVDQDMTDRVVESAVQHALDERRWPTAYALRTLYDDHRLNPRMVRLIDAIYTNRANDAERQAFAQVMTFKKKEGAKDRMGEYYFNGDGSDPLPLDPPVYSAGNARTHSFSTPSGNAATRAGSINDAQARRSSLPVLSGSPYKDSDASSYHINKKHKSNDFKAPADLEIDGKAETNGEAKTKNPSAPGQENEEGGANGTTNIATRSRSNSISSSSSLSSLDEAVIGNGGFSNAGSPLHKMKDSSHLAGHVSDAQSHSLSPTQHLKSRSNKKKKKNSSKSQNSSKSKSTSPRFANGNANANTTSSAETHPGLHNHTQPINGPQKLGGPKTFTFSTIHTGALPSSTNNPANAKSLQNHHRRPSSAAPTASSPSMAPAALLPTSRNSASTTPNLPPSIIFKTKKDTLSSKNLKRDHEEDVASRMKRIAREKARDNPAPSTESFMRHQVTPLDVESASDGGDSIAGGKQSRRPQKVRLLNNKKTRQSQAQVVNYDSDTLSSPTLLSFQPDLAPGSISASRAGTPNTLRPTRKAKTGTGLRVKTSPMKKKGGTAGIPRASGERNSPSGNGLFPSNQDDNDDYCSSCGGNGDLVCCDGCTRSFHFKCVDPPIDEGKLPDEWFCNICLNSRIPPSEPAGSFGALLVKLDGKNPSAFHLPKDIREYFENVKTGTEGEYEEVALRTQRKNNAAEEQPDYFKLKDSKGKAILCSRCNLQASAPNRAIVPCTFCSLSWHLDCLDVPLAKEPGRPWRCPAHVDDLLGTIPNVLAPAHRFRKIKGSSVIKQAVTRGLKNNGHIEIENEPTDDEEELGFFEQREYGRVYKVPEHGIKLDFISRVQKLRQGVYSLPQQVVAQKPLPPPTVPWNQRTLDEQQAALNLSSLIITPPGDNVQILVDTLLEQMSPTVIGLIAKSETQGGAIKAKRVALEKLKLLIEGSLAALPVEDNEESEEVVPEAVPEAEVEINGKHEADIEMSG